MLNRLLYLVFFVSIYRPPNCSISSFLDEFMEFVGCLSAKSLPYLLCGDFNIHWDNPSNSDTLKFRSVLESCDLLQYVNFATHLQGHTLDFLIAPTSVEFVGSPKCDGCFSDHFVVKATVNLPSGKNYDEKLISFRRFNEINMGALQDDLKRCPFVNCPSDSLDELVLQYDSSLTQIIDKHAPLITKKIRNVSNTTPVWITDEYISARQLRRQYERTWRKHKCPLHRSRLRRQVNLCNRILNKCRTSYFTSMVTANQNDSSKLWKCFKRLLNKNKSTSLPDGPNEKSIADKFGKFFVDKIQKIRNAFGSTVHDCRIPSYTPATFSKFEAVSESFVRKVIMSSPTKSCTLDPWPTFLVKECIDILLPSIAKLINLSLTNGVFPTKFKTAIVTPLLKKSNLSKNEMKNYRPVSGLSFLSKITERVIAAQVTAHLDSNNLGSRFQSAYKSGHSTETALLQIKNDIHLGLAHGKCTALVLLDLSAAFDTIDHTGLIECLSSWFGFSGTVLNWFRSYLSDRIQKVKVGNVLSDPADIVFGVPQGSVLGPILFSLYTVPLSTVIAKYPNLFYHFYADDTQLYFYLSPKSDSSCFYNLQSCLSDIQKWMSSSKLKLNPDKTEFILFGSEAQRKALTNCFPVDILGCMLNPVEKVRNLGVIFDSSFSFSSHVSSICQRCFVGIRDLGRIRRYVTTDCAILLANALVSSHLDYCNSIFRSVSASDLKRLQSIQNSIARIVAKKSRQSHITPVLKHLHWLPIKFRSIFKTLTLVYKFLDTGFPSYFDSSIKQYTTSFTSRRSDPSKKFLFKPTFDRKVHKSSKQFDFAFGCDAPRLWNDLPDVVRLAPSLSCFRKKLKSHLFHLAYPP